jgi:monooxygenase
MDFEPGYVLRSLDALPKQGAHSPWRLSMSYILDVFKIRRERVDDGVLQFTPGRAGS